MGDELIQIRLAELRDSSALARVHAAAWRSTYQGLIPHLDLTRMIARRGPKAWARTISAGDVLVLRFNGVTQGYASIGASRASGADGEIFELYLAPEFQGVGLGKRLFLAAQSELRRRGLTRLTVWALEENSMACDFYARLGGAPSNRSIEGFGGATLNKIAFTWS